LEILHKDMFDRPAHTALDRDVIGSLIYSDNTVVSIILLTATTYPPSLSEQQMAIAQKGDELMVG